MRPAQHPEPTAAERRMLHINDVFFDLLARRPLAAARLAYALATIAEDFESENAHVQSKPANPCRD